MFSGRMLMRLGNRAQSKPLAVFLTQTRYQKHCLISTFTATIYILMKLYLNGSRDREIQVWSTAEASPEFTAVDPLSTETRRTPPPHRLTTCRKARYIPEQPQNLDSWQTGTPSAFGDSRHRRILTKPRRAVTIGSRARSRWCPGRILIPSECLQFDYVIPPNI